jgi:acyl-CoA thioesterase FadM
MLASYVLRAAVTTASSFTRPRASLLEEVELPFTAWLSDIDWNGHVNNGRYLTLMDHGRIDHMLRTGLLGSFIKTHCRPMVAHAAIRYRREIRPFRRCTLVTRIRGWDDRRTYYAHSIEREGELYAQADIAVALRLGNRTVSLAEVLERSGRKVPENFLEARLSSDITDPDAPASTFNS